MNDKKRKFVYSVEMVDLESKKGKTARLVAVD